MDSGEYRHISARDIASDALGQWVVIDDNPEADQVLVVPLPWGHRQLVERDEAVRRFGDASPATARQLAFDFIALARTAGMPDSYWGTDQRLHRAFLALGFEDYDAWLDAGAPATDEELAAV